MRHLFGSAFVLLAFAANCGQAQAPDSPWNQFRGPNGSGVADQCRPPVEFGSDSLAWNTPLPSGYSSPVLSEDRVFLTATDGGRLVTLALDKASGEIVWRREAPQTPLEKVHETGSPAASTPCIDRERVYVYFGSFGLLCYDHDGEEQWRMPIPTPANMYGMAVSPILHEGLLILVLDSNENLPDSKLSRSKIIALDRATGELAWETARPLVRDGWSTPMIWENEGGKELVVLGSGRVCGYDPATGEEKWFVTGFSRETIAVPIAGDGRVYASASKLGGTGDMQPDPAPFWNALLEYDEDGDGRVSREEAVGDFTFPLRPELPREHPGRGIPLPKDESKRKGRQESMFGWVDKDKDGFWTLKEFEAMMSPNGGRPLLVAIRPGGSGDVTETHVDWEVNRNIPEIPSPIFHDGLIYMVRNGGIVSAVDTADGAVLYRERLGTAGQYSASPIIAGGCLYLASERGVLSVVKLGNRFELLHQYDMETPISATPAVDATTLYVRTEEGLSAFREKE